MRKIEKTRKKTAVTWSLKYTTYPVRLVIKHLFRVQIGYVVFFFGPPEAGLGGGSRQVEWSPHTEIFIFAAISRATDARFFNVFISLDLVSISFPMPYSKLFYCKNSRRYGEKKTESRKRWLGFS